jgi:hypothetical protein
MITEAQRRCLSALSKVGVELHLRPQGDTCTDPFGLASLGVADCLREREDVPGGGGRHKQHAIVIAEGYVVTAHCPIAHSGRLQCVLRTNIEAPRSGGDRSEAEDRQPIARRSAVSRCSPQITIPSRPAA